MSKVIIDELRQNSKSKLLSIEGINSCYFEQVLFDDVACILSSGEECTIKYTNVKRPIVYVGDDFFLGKKSLCIDKKYYEDHKEEIKFKIIDGIKNYNGKCFYIDNEEMLDTEYIEALCSNHNIEIISLGEKIPLNSELYKRFKEAGKKSIKSKSVTEDLQENFDRIIEFNRSRLLIGKYNYSNLTMAGNVSFTEPIYEFKYLKLPYKNADIIFWYHDYDNIFEAIDYMRNNGINNRVLIQLDEIDFYSKNKFNAYLLSHLNYLEYANVMISFGERKYSLIDYFKYEERLIKMVSPALNLSSLEKYLYAYNLVKNYKQYKDNKENDNVAKNLYDILDNEFMVCSGYSNMLGDLLNKLGIPSYDLAVNIDTGLDDVGDYEMVLPNDTLVKASGHARRVVHLVDPKYGIDGIYLADPTWDNDLEHDYYNFALMSQDEYNGICRYNFIDFGDVDEVFFVHSVEEFYDKANKWMDRYVARNEKECDGNTNKEIQYSVQLIFIKYFMYKLEALDMAKYQEMANKYKAIINYNDDKKPSKQELSECISDLAMYVLSKVNKPISGKTLRDAIIVLYEQNNDHETAVTKVNEVMRENEQRQILYFPLRYKVTSNGEMIPYLNTINKFELDDEQLSKKY